MEATAIYVDGWVERGGVGQATYLFEFPTAGEIRARLRHPGSELRLGEAMTPLYNLMAGFYAMGVDVEVIGPWPQKLPGQGRLVHPQRPALALRPIFQDHLPPAERTPDLDLAVLSDIFQAVTQTGRNRWPEVFPRVRKEPKKGSAVFLTHSSGVEVTALGKSHQVSGRTPLSAGMMTDNFDEGPRPVRTWGEAWIRHWASARCDRPQALHILPSEVALVHGEFVTRYALEDSGTLRDLSLITFGPGVSSCYTQELWLAMANSCGEKAAYPMALACCEQALLLDDTATARAERQRWLDWQEYHRNPPSVACEAADEPLQSFHQLLEKVGFEKEILAVTEEIRQERAEAHDFRRSPNPLRPVLSGSGNGRFQLGYPPVTGADLLAAGVTPKTLARLGYEGPIPPPQLYPDIFTIRCGSHTLWGTISSNTWLLKSEVYQINA